MAFVMRLVSAQQTFLVFYFMKVDESNIMNTMAIEDFWEKIYQEGIKEGAYTGWNM